MNELSDIIEKSTFLIIGGAGSIGSSLSIEIFKRNPKLLHVVDISENNTVELVEYQCSGGYIKGEFKTFAIDCSSNEFNLMITQNPLMIIYLTFLPSNMLEVKVTLIH